MKNILCKIGIHWSDYVFGSFHRYYECRRCGNRHMTRGIGGYQPVNEQWLAYGLAGK